MDESTNRKNQYPNTTTAPQSTVPPPTQAPDVSTQPQQPEIPSTQRPDAPQFAAEQSKDAASESACKCYHDSNAGGNAPGSVPGGCRKHRPGMLQTFPRCEDEVLHHECAQQCSVLVATSQQAGRVPIQTQAPVY